MSALPAGHRLRIFPDASGLMEGATAMVVEALNTLSPRPRLVLAGGNTPAPLYTHLASPSNRGKVDWRQVWFTFGDERSVPPGDPESNFGMIQKTLLDPVGARTVIRLRGEDPADSAAEKAHKALVPWAERTPLFDLVLLGVGDDGHVASLFPAESWPDFGMRYAAATVNPQGQPRITLTPLALRSTRQTLFLVSGEGKAEAVREALTAPSASPRQPSRMVVDDEGVAVWCLDEAAASQLPPEFRGEGTS